MNTILQNIKNWWIGLYKVWRREYTLVFSDIGVMLFFFALPTLYPVVYSLIYNPELVKNIPIVVVDNDRTAESRSLARMFDASEPMKVKGYAVDMAETRTAMASKECYGVLEIPRGYSRNITDGQAHVSFYSDMSLLLRYRQFSDAIANIQLTKATQVSQKKLDEMGLVGQTLSPAASPMEIQQTFVGDPSQGFASFIMPGILVLIIQQSIILGVTMIAGGAAERRRRNRGYDPMWVHAPATAHIIGKTLCYLTLYAPMLIYMLHIVPWMFKFPHYGNLAESMLLMLPLIIASSMLGQCIGVFVRERESSMLVVVFTSAVFLFLSGLTWPRYAMSGFWRLVSGCIPATWGLQGFVHINSDNASLAQQSVPWDMLWILAAVYFAGAWLIARGYCSINRRSPQVKDVAPDEVTIP